ncbi:hypothetical protein ACN4EG_08655 [Alkalinema pantanalense CENA528]|uniref:hypothetical protein n=1 Tax=Alkalinema pantanalense TaxID=1620705 RepID=UPI003D6F62F9
MPTTVNLDPELLQAIQAIASAELSLDAIIEEALRSYLQQHNKPNPPIGFGDALLEFRKQHNLDQIDLNPDEIWANIRDRDFTGNEVVFE